MKAMLGRGTVSPSIVAGDVFKAGDKWLRSAKSQRAGNAVAWPHIRGISSTPSVWGGTIEAILGLKACGAPADDEDVNDGLNWLLSQQRTDGGWGSNTITYSSAEATSWAIVLLRQCFPNAMSMTQLSKAVAYLELCIDRNGGVMTSPADQKPLIYTSSVALLALHGVSSRASEVIRFLDAKLQRGLCASDLDVDRNSVATSALAVYALLKAGTDKNEPTIRRVVSEVIARQSPDGSWSNETIYWGSSNQQAKLRCNLFTTAIALIALSRADSPESRYAASRAGNWLIRTQDQQKGNWIFDATTDKEYVWCTGLALWALDEFRRASLPSLSHMIFVAPRQSLAFTAFILAMGYLGGAILGLPELVNGLPGYMASLVVWLASHLGFEALKHYAWPLVAGFAAIGAYAWRKR